jgi:hypothetical protein
VVRRGSRVDEILAALRKERGQHGTIIGPDNEGRVMITDDEGTRGAGRPSYAVGVCACADEDAPIFSY